MSYDVSKMTNLGQMKSALQKIVTEVGKAKSIRRTIAISAANWVAAGDIWVYNDTLNANPRYFYNIHLDSRTSDAVSIMCANSDIRASLDENNHIILTAYAAKPTANFTLEIIAAPMTTNDIGLTYDIGDDFLVYPSITDSLAARISALETASANATLLASNVSVASSKWVASGDATYPYKAELLITDVTSEHFPVVQFRDSDSLLYDFSPNAATSAGKVIIYCKTAPSSTIVLPSIMCFKCTPVSAT